MRVRTAIGLLSRASALAVCALAATPAGAELPKFQVLDLGTLGGTYSRAHALNEAGQVTGTSSTAGDTEYHAFRWDDSMVDLGTLGGTLSEGRDINDSGVVAGRASDSQSEVHAVIWDSSGIALVPVPVSFDSTAIFINDGGQVAGSFVDTDATGEETVEKAFIWDGESIVNLGAVLGTWYPSAPMDLNESGQVIIGSGCQSPYLWNGSSLIELETLRYPGEACANDLNDAGQISGTAFVAGDVTHMVRWDGTSVVDLGSIGGDDAQGRAINESGQIAGAATTASPREYHAVFWDGASLVQLGTLGGNTAYATDVNDDGQVVGISAKGAYSDYRVFYWNGGQMRDLNELAVPSALILREVVEINNSGQIAGSGYTATGHQHAFLATPIALLFSRLIDEVTGVGPGKSLATTVRTASEYYVADDLQATCVAMEYFGHQLNSFSTGKKPKIAVTLAGELVGDGQEIEDALGCPQ